MEYHLRRRCLVFTKERQLIALAQLLQLLHLKFLDALCGGRQILRHRPTEIGNRSTHHLANHVVRLISGILADYTFAADFVCRLRGTEEVRCQFR